MILSVQTSVSGAAHMSLKRNPAQTSNRCVTGMYFGERMICDLYKYVLLTATSLTWWWSRRERLEKGKHVSMASKRAADDDTWVTHWDVNNNRGTYCTTVSHTNTERHSPGLRFPLEQALSPPLRVGAEMVGQLTTNLLHRSQRVALLSNTQRDTCTNYQLSYRQADMLPQNIQSVPTITRIGLNL